jgi:hypothetical protein
MNKVQMKTIATGLLLGAPSLATAHSASHTELAPLHFLTSLDHMSVFALIAAGTFALVSLQAVSHLRKASTRKQ